MTKKEFFDKIKVTRERQQFHSLYITVSCAGTFDYNCCCKKDDSICPFYENNHNINGLFYPGYFTSNNCKLKILNYLNAKEKIEAWKKL
jgi:hypothetical protein